jgi:hypothetical protein
MNVAYSPALTRRELVQCEAHQHDSRYLRTHVSAVELRILQ